MELDKQHFKAQLFLTIAAVVTFTLVLLAFVATFVIPVFIPGMDPPAAVKEMVALVLGALIMVYKEVYGFWFGSSHGSLRKSIVDKPGAEPEGG